MIRRILLLAVGLVLYTPMFSQGYVISYNEDAGNPGNLSTDSYITSTGWTEISGGGQSANEWTSPVQIPFAFDFYGSAVTHLLVSLNGVVTFDTATAILPADNSSLPTSSLPDSSIACFWDAFTSSPPLSTADDIDIKTFGTSPNRQFWIRWQGFELNGNSNVYMACVLEESTNKIYVVDRYSSNSSGLSATVGVQLNSTTGNDVGSNLTVSGNATTITDNDYYEFTFVPAGTCFPPSDLTAIAYTSSSVTLTWNETASGSTFTVEYGPDGFSPGTGQTISGITDTFQVVSSLSYYTDYDFYVSEDCSSGSISSPDGPASALTAIAAGWKEDFSGTFVPMGWFEAQGVIGNPTAFTSTTSAGWTQDEFSNVGNNDAANELISGSSNEEWLITYTMELPASNNLNLEFDASLTVSGANIADQLATDDTIHVVISTDDGQTWNRSDALLTLDENTTFYAGSGAHYTLPLSSYSGLVRIGFYTESQTTNKISDFFIDNVQLRAAQSCPQPSALIASNITSTGADLTWDANGGTNFEIIWGPPGFNQATVTATSISGNTYSLSGLNPYTEYDVFLWNDCSGGNSDTIVLLSLITAIQPDWIEDFEGSSFVPLGWEERDGVLANPTTFTSFFSSSWGSDNFANTASLGKAARTSIFSFTSALTEWLITPLIDLGTGNNYQLEFDAALTSSSGSSQGSFDADDSLIVVISTDGGVTWSNANTLLELGAGNDPVNTGSHYIISLSSYSGIVKLGFYVRSTTSAGSSSRELFVDNIEVKNTPSCPAPFNLAITGDADSATFIWEILSPSTPYTVEYGPAGFSLGSASGTQITSIQDTFVTINSLLPQTKYDFYVKADCSGIPSQYGGPISYVTPCAPLIAPFTENFDNWGAGTGTATSGDSISVCWDRNPNTTSSYSWRVRSGTTPSSNTGPLTDRSGSGNYVFAEASSTGAPARITIPSVDISQLNTPEVVFYYHMYGEDMGSTYLEVSDGVQTYSNIRTVTGEQQAASGDAYLEFIGNLAPFNFASDTISISIVAVRGSDFESDVAIDDFEIREAQTCPIPLQLNVQNITTNSASLIWSSGTGISNLEWGPAGFQQGSGTGNLVKNVTSPFPLTGLSPNTSYDFYIQDSCTAFSNSIWVGPFTFTTQCSLILNGSYTIGGAPSPTNFPDLDSAIAVLNQCGVSGPVILDIQPGTYSGAFVIDSIPGGSSTNTVTFRGSDATQVIITHDGSISEATLLIQKADYLTFKTVTIENTKGATDMWGIVLRDQADHITIDSCRFIQTQASLSDASHIMAGSSLTSSSSFTSGANNANHLTISNSYFEGSSFGVTILGDDPIYLQNITITGNEFTGQDDYAVYIYDSENLEIAGNNIHDLRGTSTDGIFANDIGDFEIYNNYIDAVDFGIYIIDGNDASFTVSTNSRIFNNILRSEGSSEPIFLNDVEFIDVDFNTTYTETGDAIRVNDFDNFNIRNNIFYSVSGLAFNSDDNLPETGNILDYNIYHPTVSSNFNPYFFNIEDGTNRYVSLAEWQTAKTGFNVNSLVGDPQFDNTTDLRTEGFLADNNGNTVSGITTDIDGSIRAATPDIGATEFSAIACPDPTALNVQNVSTSSADLTWNGSGTAYEVEWGALGFTQGNGTVISTSSLTTTLSSLNAGTAYDFYVRNDCSPTPGNWVGPFSFITNCGAALSGVYTIDPSLPVSATNYPTVRSAALSLSVCGISGPVVFNIAAGNYNGPVVFNEISGTSAINTVTFNGSSASSVIISSTGTEITGNQATILMDSTDYVTFNNVTIQNTGSVEAFGALLIHDANHNSFTGCVFEMQQTASADVVGLVTSNSFINDVSSGDNAAYLTIDGCIFNGGEKGLCINGPGSGTLTPHVSITNSTFRFMDEYAMDIDGIDTLIISGNNISDITDNSTSYAIELDDVENFRISGNNIIAADEAISIFDGNDEGNNPSQQSEIFNNMIIAGGDHGLDLTDINFVDVYHNSIIGEPAIEIDDFDGIDIRNNIFYGRASEAFLSADALGSLSKVDIDYNLYYGSDTSATYPIDIDGTDYATLALWATADNTRNANSLEGDPEFFDVTDDLHVEGSLANEAGDNTLGIIVDIDGQARPGSGATIVDIGADEYVPASCFTPDSITQLSNTSTSVELDWVSGGASNWQIEYGSEGFALGSGTMVGIISKPHTITGLSSYTCYDVYVRDSCAPGDVSRWKGPFKACTDYSCAVTTTPTISGDTIVCTNDSTILVAASTTTFTLWKDDKGYIFQNNDSLEVNGITSDTSFTVQDAERGGPQYAHVGPLTSIAVSGFGNFSNGMMFTALNHFVLDSVNLRSDGAQNGLIRIFEPDSIDNANIDITNARLIASVPYNLTAAGEFQVPVGLALSPGQYFINLSFADPNGGLLFRATSGADFPYVLHNVVSIDSSVGVSTFPSTRVYYFFDWVVSGLCTGPEVAVNIDTVNNPPVAAFTNSFNPATPTDRDAIFDASTSTGSKVTYTWDFGDNNTGTGINPTHTYTANGTYTVKLIVENACGIDSITNSIVIDGIGLEDNVLERSLLLFPNPASERLQLDFNTGDSEDATITLMDMSGKIVRKIEENSINGELSMEIDVHDLADGVYTLQITTNRLSAVRRFLKN